jgi:hypothetical protein
VEEERGGRLAKLDELAAILERLERVAMENSTCLGKNLRIRTLWSVLRAVKKTIGAASFPQRAAPAPPRVGGAGRRCHRRCFSMRLRLATQQTSASSHWWTCVVVHDERRTRAHVG